MRLLRCLQCMLGVALLAVVLMWLSGLLKLLSFHSLQPALPSAWQGLPSAWQGQPSAWQGQPSTQQDQPSTQQDQHVLPAPQHASPEQSPSPEEAWRSPGFLVFHCSDRGPWTSWPELQSGIVSAYVLSQMLGRVFAVRVIYPCKNFTSIVVNDLFDLEQVVGERFWDSGPFGELVLVPGEDPDRTLGKDYPQEFLLLAARRDLLETLSSSKLASRSALLRQAGSKADVYRSAMTSLFRPPTPAPLDAGSEGGPDVCAHVVLGPGTHAGCLGARVLHDLLSLLGKEARKGRVYLSTDSRQLALKAQKLISPKALVLHQTRPAATTETKSAATTETKSAATTETKSAATTETKSAATTETKTAATLVAESAATAESCQAFQEEVRDQETLRRCRTLAVNHFSGLVAAYWHVLPRDLELYCMTSSHLVPCNVHMAWDVMESDPFRCPPPAKHPLLP